MNPDYDGSLEFLTRWGSPWILTAISVDKKQITTRTFEEADSCRKWLEKMGVERNIYFSVNPTTHAVASKPGRADVRSMDWLHVDIDPREWSPPPGNLTEQERAESLAQHITQEQERALGTLREPPGKIPPPTVIIFSGGGYQGFWRLSEPWAIDGQEPRYEEAARFNQALELAFGADNCHNVDRIMRLPGTLNRPDAKKARKGRTIALAKLVSWDTDRVYDIGSFEQSRPVQTATSGFGQTRQVQVDGNIERLGDVADLPEAVPDKCKVVIVQGDDPDNPYGSRSEALFYVCCELVRAEVSDDLIYSILTDPDFGISDSILDKGANAKSYALRQIERAHEDAIDPNLRELNEKYACVPFGGRMRVIYEQYEEMLDRERLVKMTFDDFRNMHMNRRVQSGTNAQGEPRMVPLGRWWLEQPHRRQYERVTFAPGRETPGAYNMWRGFNYEAVAGDGHELFLGHVRENICSGDEALFEYVLGWMARAVQLPDQPAQTAIVLRGDQGVGKGFLAKTIGRLFGRHYVHVSNAQHLTGNFNAHLRDCVVLFADEAFYAGDKRHASVLKTLVTEDAITVEPKGVDTEMVANCLHILMASNSDWVVPAGLNERRFCVLDVSDNRRQDASYFQKIGEALRLGGYGNLLHFLMNYDLSQYSVRKLPETDALRQQKIHSFDAMEEWWFGKLMEGKLCADHESWQPDVLAEELRMDFVEYTRQFNVSRRGTATRLGNFLATVMPDKRLVKTQSNEQVDIGGRTIRRPYWYTVPPIERCREWWDRRFGGPYKWPRRAGETLEPVTGSRGDDLPF